MGITSTVEKITDGQTAQIKSLVEHALRKSGVGKDGAQLIITRGDDLKDRMTAIFEELGIENQYADEKVDPDTDFSYDLRTLPGTDEQIAKQLEAMGLKGKVEAVRCTVQEHLYADAEGFAVVPSLTDLGKRVNMADPLGDDYGTLLEAMLGFLSMQRTSAKFTNYRAGELTKDHVRLHPEARRHWEQLEALTEAEDGKVRFFIIPVNFGSKYQGYSPRNARTDALAKGTMPLDPVAVAAILLGWPEWQEKWENSAIDCSGAEYSWDADGEWTRVCYFHFYDSELEFYARDAGCPRGGCGTAVAFPGVPAA